MRIENGNRVGNASARARGPSAGSGAAFTIEEGRPATGTASASAAAPGQAISALLALQSVEDPALKKRQLVRRGAALLDALEDLKADLLIGRVSEGRLNLLMALIRQAREQSEPGLDGLLDDIELRARVELAKRGLFPGQ